MKKKKRRKEKRRRNFKENSMSILKRIVFASLGYFSIKKLLDK
jgi:hypothetical protein